MCGWTGTFIKGPGGTCYRDCFKGIVLKVDIGNLVSGEGKGCSVFVFSFSLQTKPGQ